jgi:broad specificity phosphatase PhoE
VTDENVAYHPIMVVRLVYETHSTTTDNETGIATGWLPGELSAQGVLNAQALGRRRRDDAVDAVFCSDLHRAVQTAAIAFEGTAIPIIQDPRLRETNYGDLNGKPTSVLHGDRLAHLNEPFPNGESWRQAADRTIEALQDIAEHWDGKRIVVIAHSAQRYILRELCEGMPFETALIAPFEWQEGWEYTLSPNTFTNRYRPPDDEVASSR